MRGFPTQAELMRWQDDGGGLNRWDNEPTWEDSLTVDAIVDQALAKCEAHGVSYEDFLRALTGSGSEVARQGPITNVRYHVARAFEQLGVKP